MSGRKALRQILSGGRLARAPPDPYNLFSIVDPPTQGYELVDFGEGRALERVGTTLLDRPCPNAIGKTRMAPKLWSQAAYRYEVPRHFPIQRGASPWKRVSNSAKHPDAAAFSCTADIAGFAVRSESDVTAMPRSNLHLPVVLQSSGCLGALDPASLPLIGLLRSSIFSSLRQPERSEPSGGKIACLHCGPSVILPASYFASTNGGSIDAFVGSRHVRPLAKAVQLGCGPADQLDAADVNPARGHTLTTKDYFEDSVIAAARRLAAEQKEAGYSELAQNGSNQWFPSLQDCTIEPIESFPLYAAYDHDVSGSGDAFSSFSEKNLDDRHDAYDGAVISVPTRMPFVDVSTGERIAAGHVLLPNDLRKIIDASLSDIGKALHCAQRLLRPDGCPFVLVTVPLLPGGIAIPPLALLKSAAAANLIPPPEHLHTRDLELWERGRGGRRIAVAFANLTLQRLLSAKTITVGSFMLIKYGTRN